MTALKGTECDVLVLWGSWYSYVIGRLFWSAHEVAIFKRVLRLLLVMAMSGLAYFPRMRKGYKVVNRRQNPFHLCLHPHPEGTDWAVARTFSFATWQHSGIFFLVFKALISAYAAISAWVISNVGARCTAVLQVYK